MGSSCHWVFGALKTIRKEKKNFIIKYFLCQVLRSDTLWQLFIFLLDGSHYVVKASLILFGKNDRHAPASPVAGAVGTQQHRSLRVILVNVFLNSVWRLENLPLSKS